MPRLLEAPFHPTLGRSVFAASSRGMEIREPRAPQRNHRGVAMVALPSMLATLSQATERDPVRRRGAPVRAALACQRWSGGQDAIDAPFAAARATRSCGRFAPLTLPRGSRSGVDRSAKRCCYRVGAFFFSRRRRRQRKPCQGFRWQDCACCTRSLLAMEPAIGGHSHARGPNERT